MKFLNMKRNLQRGKIDMGWNIFFKVFYFRDNTLKYWRDCIVCFQLFRSYVNSEWIAKAVILESICKSRWCTGLNFFALPNVFLVFSCFHLLVTFMQHVRKKQFLIIEQHENNKVETAVLHKIRNQPELGPTQMSKEVYKKEHNRHKVRFIQN